MCTRCSYPAYTCKNCPVVVNYWEALPFAWKEISEGIKDVHMTLQDLCVIYNSASKSKNWKPEDFTPKIKTTELSFEEALSAAKNGKWIARSDWNGKNQYVCMLEGGEELGTLTFRDPFLVLFNTQGRYAPWVPSMGDLFSNKWMIVDESTFKASTSTVYPYQSPYQGSGSSTSTVRIKDPDKNNVTYI